MKAGSESAPSRGTTNSNPFHCLRHSHPSQANRPGTRDHQRGRNQQLSFSLHEQADHQPPSGPPPGTRRPTPWPGAPRSCVLHWGEVAQKTALESPCWHWDFSASQAFWNLSTGFSHIQMSTVLLEIETPTPPPRLPSHSAWISEKLLWKHCHIGLHRTRRPGNISAGWGISQALSACLETDAYHGIHLE